jgi:hypothetical protein
MMTDRIHRRRRSRGLVIALYLNAALLAAILLVVIERSGGPPQILSAAWAQNQMPIGGGAGVFLIPAQFSPGQFGCYLMDVDSQTLCAYQYANSKLRLIASRSFQYDRKLRNYNTDNPNEIKQLVDLEQQAARVNERNTERPPVEAPQKQE